ncbi:MAG TPA: nickel-dependent hydrogenase large subunit [Xanthobacteraceae bacterium]|nr:nickel-dependent hydrogenase large subunit [Xanthobacteraceae bacterium]
MVTWPTLDQEIRLDAALIDGRLEARRLVTTRASGVAGALVGYPVDQIPHRLSQLFPLCGTAHAIAALLALEAALGVEVSSAQQGFRKLLLLAEHGAALGWRLAMDWPPFLGAAPQMRACADIRHAAAAVAGFVASPPWVRIGGGKLRVDRDGLRGAVATLARMLAGLFPEATDPALSWSAFELALEGGTSAPARLIRTVRAGAMAAYGAHDRPQLPPVDAAWFARRLATDPGFSDAPTLDGAPAEVGAFAARRHRLVDEAEKHWGPTLATRLLAAALDTAVVAGQLSHVVDVPADDDPVAVDITRAGQGAGVVETARGPLSYFVDVADARARVLRAVAPTEWNFHPKGPFMAALDAAAAVPAPDHAARLLAASFDPCVPFRIESLPGLRPPANAERARHA